METDTGTIVIEWFVCHEIRILTSINTYLQGKVDHVIPVDL